MATRVLVVERRQAQRPSFADALKKRYEVLTASSGKDAANIVSQFQPDIVILDAISMRTPGDRICQQIQSLLPETPLIHLHPGTKDAQSCADVVLLQPFTARKIVNVIERLVGETQRPKTEESLVCGPFTLHAAQRVLVFNDRETSLTPKLAQLVELFMRNPGQTLDRKRLMNEVWNTDYLGDTRTLDVHIRWIRRAIEADPGKPIYLKTVRGIGYRLEGPWLTETASAPAHLELTPTP